MITAGIASALGRVVRSCARVPSALARVPSALARVPSALARVPSALARIIGAPLAEVSPDHLLRADAIVILGAPLGPDGELSAVAEERVREGVALWERGLADVICVVGGHCPRGHRAPDAEAEGMARWVRARGVPERAIRVDRLSTSTLTNARHAAAILLPEGRRRVLLVTQPFHLRRACFYFRREGFEPLGWHIDDSLQYREPARALRWIVREYGAWGLALWNTRPSAPWNTRPSAPWSTRPSAPWNTRPSAQHPVS